MLQPAYIPVQQQAGANPYGQPVYAVPANQSNSMEKHPYDSPPESGAVAKYSKWDFFVLIAYISLTFIHLFILENTIDYRCVVLCG